MHQSMLHTFLVRVTLCVILLFSVAGFHHHDATHICLGWEHLMLHNHCQKGSSCLPSESHGQESHCHCHSGKIIGMGQAVKKATQKSVDIPANKMIGNTALSFFFFTLKDHSIGFSSGNSPRGPCPELYAAHGLRAPPTL